MRISNLQFAKGSIIYATFSGQENAYLNGRPLLVVSNFIPIYSSVWAVPITSQCNKPGIRCTLWNYHSNSALGGTECSIIKVNEILSVKTHLIHDIIGIMEPRIMKKVDKAVQYFLGISDEIPEFLREIEESNEPEYTNLSRTLYDENEVVSYKYQRPEIVQPIIPRAEAMSSTTVAIPDTLIEPAKNDWVYAGSLYPDKTYTEVVSNWKSSKHPNYDKKSHCSIIWMSENIDICDIPPIILRRLPISTINQAFQIGSPPTAYNFRDALFCSCVTRFVLNCKSKRIDDVDVITYIILNHYVPNCKILQECDPIPEQILKSAKDYYEITFTSTKWCNTHSTHIKKLLEAANLE